MIELDDWIFAMSLDEHEEMVGSFERVMVDSGGAVSVCPFGYAPKIPMSNHSMQATLRIASGAQMEHAVQKTVEHETGDGELVNVNFEVADESNLCLVDACWTVFDQPNGHVSISPGNVVRITGLV